MLDKELLRQISEAGEEGWVLCSGCLGCPEPEDQPAGYQPCDIQTRKNMGTPPERIAKMIRKEREAALKVLVMKDAVWYISTELENKPVDWDLVSRLLLNATATAMNRRQTRLSKLKLALKILRFTSTRYIEMHTDDEKRRGC